MIKDSGITVNAGLSINCGSCIHHNNVAFYEKPCIELGVEDYALAPSKCFKPNVHQLAEQIPVEVLVTLGKLSSKLENPQTLKLLAHSISNIAICRQQGYNFGQSVYFSLGGDYLSHYFKGILVAVQDGQATISTKLHQSTNSTIVMIDINSVLTKSKWEEHKLKLINQSKVVAPANLKHKYLPELLDHEGRIERIVTKKQDKAKSIDYEPPTIDTSVDDLITSYRKTQDNARKARNTPPTITTSAKSGKPTLSKNKKPIKSIKSDNKSVVSIGEETTDDLLVVDYEMEEV